MVDFINGRYPELDLSRLFMLPKSAIRCNSEEEVNAVVYNMYHKHRKHIASWLIDGKDHGFNFWEPDYNCLNVFDVPEKSTNIGLLRKWPEHRFREKGFEIIDFDKFIISDVAESGNSVDMLLFP